MWAVPERIPAASKATSVGDTTARVGDAERTGAETVIHTDATCLANESPSFVHAADPGEAEELVEAFARALETGGLKVGRGVFGAEMEVELVNDGPFTMWLDGETP